MIVDQDSEYTSGFFLSEDPIPFDGTVVHVTASGYCALGKEQPALILIFAQPNTTNRFDIENVPAVCDKTSSLTSNVTVGRVDEAVRIAVSAGDYLVIPFNSQCVSNKICTFWPATNSESKRFFYLNKSKTNNDVPSSITFTPTIGLYFSFIIESEECRGPGDQSQLMHILLPVFLTTTLLLFLIIVAWLLHKYYRKRRKNQLGLSFTNCFSSVSNGNEV
jgi:hypothetical protein